ARDGNLYAATYTFERTAYGHYMTDGDEPSDKPQSLQQCEILTLAPADKLDDVALRPEWPWQPAWFLKYAPDYTHNYFGFRIEPKPYRTCFKNVNGKRRQVYKPGLIRFGPI